MAVACGWNTVSWLDTDNGMALAWKWFLVFGFAFSRFSSRNAPHLTSDPAIPSRNAEGSQPASQPLIAGGELENPVVICHTDIFLYTFSHLLFIVLSREKRGRSKNSVWVF